MLPWLEGGTFDKLLFSIAYNECAILVSYQKRGNILIWSFEQIRSARAHIKILKQYTQWYKIIDTFLNFTRVGAISVFTL